MGDTKSNSEEKNSQHNKDTNPENRTGESFDVDKIRLNFQKKSAKLEIEENKKKTRGVIFRVGIILALGILLFLLTTQIRKAYQTAKINSAATLTAEFLFEKYQNAETFMIAGRPKEALQLYSEIQNKNPAYKDIDKKINAAEKYITVMDLYEKSIRLLNEGKHNEAMPILLEIENLHPQYKDTPELIKKIEQEQQITALVKAMESSYYQQNWAEVIQNYENIQTIDPFFELPELKDILFTSYKNLIISLAGRGNLTLEEIETAENYYRKALALVPQDKAYVKEREELKKIAVERLANKYYLHAINLIESSNYSVKGLRESIRILNKAENIEADSPIIKSEIEKAQLFLDSYTLFLGLEWDEAINGFEILRRKEENYAGGRVKYFLYEAYIARGDTLFAYADFEGAFLDYQEAEEIAWSEDQNLTQLFEIETRIAAALEKMDKIDESAEFYKFAFDKLEYKKILTSPEQRDLLNTLEQARLAFEKKDKLEAMHLYQMAMKSTGMLYKEITVSVKQGDTLANISFENGSTIESLRRANKISESMVINSDQDILIPVISKR